MALFVGDARSVCRWKMGAYHSAASGQRKILHSLQYVANYQHLIEPLLKLTVHNILKTTAQPETLILLNHIYHLKEQPVQPLYQQHA